MHHAQSLLRRKGFRVRVPMIYSLFLNEILLIPYSTRQAATSAYLAHSFTSSLMSRWLLHYSPPAVLLRLCSMSILLSYACVTCFRLSGATEANLPALSRSLPIWIVISVVLLLVYFCTQQDISVEGDTDDRRRRLVLRIKCLYTMASSSLFSLLVMVGLIHFSTIDWDTVSFQEWTKGQAAQGLLWWEGLGERLRSEL